MSGNKFSVDAGYSECPISTEYCFVCFYYSDVETRANILFQRMNWYEQYMEVKSEALIMGFLKILNQEKYINNETYLEAVDKLKKGDVKKNVN